MHSKFSIHGAPWCKWLLRFALISFLGLYSIGLLPHKHASAIPDELNCPVCHAVNGLTKLTGNGNPPAPGLTAFVLQLLLVLAWAPIARFNGINFPSCGLARAPPLL